MPRLRDIRSLHVILTAGCNLSCTYCYQNAKRPRGMSWRTLRASADLLLGSSRPEVKLVFLGGEPLLKLPLIRRTVSYCERRRPRGKKIRYEVITNGTLITSDTLSFLAGNRFKTYLSFDGVPGSQALRGSGTFEILDGLLVRMRERYPGFFQSSVRVGMTVTSATIPCLAESIDYFLGRGVQEISMAPVFTHDPGWRADRIRELDEQLARVYRSCLRHYRRTGEVPLMLFRNPGRPSRRRDGGKSMCGAPRGETLSVDIDGEVHGCVTFGLSYESVESGFLRPRLEGMKMGDLRSPGFASRHATYPEAARETGIFDRKEEKYSTYGRCGECRFFRSCRICPVSIGHIPGNTDPNRVPDFLCAWSLVTLKHASRFPRRPDTFDLLTGRAPLPTLLRELEAFGASAARSRSSIPGGMS